MWGIPSGAIDATNINKKETIYYYTYDKYGKAELQKIMVENNTVNATSNDISNK